MLHIMPSLEHAHAIPAAVKAKSEFMQAGKMFNEGKFSGAIEHSESAKKVLGKSNSRIEYLLTKAYFERVDYGKALIAIEAFFELTPESESGSKQYDEMVVGISDLRLELPAPSRRGSLWVQGFPEAVRWRLCCGLEQGHEPGPF